MNQMKATGMVRPVDKLGRVVIPREIRRQFNITSAEDSFEIFVEDDKIILKKYQPSCVFCGQVEHTEQIENRIVCADCMKKIAARAKELD